MTPGDENSARRWGTALAVTFAMVFPSILTWFYFVALAGNGAGNSAQQLTYSLGKSVQFFFPVCFVLAVAPAQLRPARIRWDGLAYGLGFGILVVAVMLAAYFGWLRGTAIFTAASAQVHLKLQEFGVDSLMGFVALAGFVVVAHSLLEEYYWRWFVFGRLRQLVPVGAAIALSSLGFMAHHVIVLNHYFPTRFLQMTLPFSLGVAVGGAAWAWLYNRTGSIWPCWLSHLLIDAGIFVIGWDLLRAR